MAKRNFVAVAKRRKIFLAVIADCANIREACRLAGVTRDFHDRWMHRIPGYPAAFNEALEEGIDRLELEAWRRAHDGVDKPIFYQGMQVATVKEYSDALLLRLLEAHRPKRWARRSEISGPGGVPLAPATVVVVELPDNGRGEPAAIEGEATPFELPPPDDEQPAEAAELIERRKAAG